MLIWYALLALIYGIYHIVFFSYSSHIFNYSKNRVLWCFVSYVVNLSFWIVNIQFLGIKYEAITSLLFICLLLAEYLLIFRLSFQSALFISLTFALNLLAKRVALVGATTLFVGGTVEEVMSQQFLQAVVLILACGLSINTITLARKTLLKIYLDTILSDKKNIRFLTGIFAIINLGVHVIDGTFAAHDGASGQLYFYIFSGVIFILSFAAFMVYAYQLANLRLMVHTVETTQAHNKTQRQLVSQLKQEAEKDMLTGLLERETIMSILANKIEKKERFFLVFLDIDGLKYANDTFGHNEGDFYIKQVADIAQEAFGGDSVGRYGGDEILAVGSYNEDIQVNAKVVRCYTAVQQISTLHNKPYPTSISYGIVFSENDSETSLSELISLGDERMYEMKKKRKKHRKTASLQST